VDTGSGDTVEVSLSVPAGGLPGDQEITIEAYDPDDLPDLPAGRTELARAFDFGPDGLTFSRPVTLTFTYADAEVAGRDESTIAAHLLVGDVWQIVPDCIDATVPSPSPCVSARNPWDNTITAVTDHFSTFCLSRPTLLPSKLPETGGGPPPGDSLSPPYVWLTISLSSLLLAALGLGRPQAP
jgi:hypothetical protein